MTAKPKRKQDDAAQSKRFLDAAREADADQTEEGADSAFKKIARPSKKSGDIDPPKPPRRR